MTSNTDSVNLTGNYIRLCEAIVNSGLKQGDQAFLHSNWCEWLISYIIDYAKSKDESNRGRIIETIKLHRRF